MGWLNKLVLMTTIGITSVTNVPQYLINLATGGKDVADRSLAEQIADAIAGGGDPASPGPGVPPNEIPITVVQPTVWDSLSGILADPLNILLIGVSIIAGAWLLRGLFRPKRYKSNRRWA